MSRSGLVWPRILVILVGVLWVSSCATVPPAPEPPAPEKPLTLQPPAPEPPAPAYPSLRNSVDPDLQQELEGSLELLGLTPAVRQKQVGIALVDISDITQPRVAAVNGDHMFYAASLPKIAILLGAFVLIERGDMTLDAETRAALTRMIRHSSNADATRMLNRVGKPTLAEILQSDRYRLYDPAFNGGLWVGKDYGKAAAWRRDPLHHLSHGATAMQTARFYYLLATDRLVSPELGQEMQAILSKPAIRHKFVKGLQSRPKVTLYRKSGTWKHWHADSVLVKREHYSYILVGLVEHAQGGAWLTRLVVAVDDLIERRHVVRPVG